MLEPPPYLPSRLQFKQSTLDRTCLIVPGSSVPTFNVSFESSEAIESDWSSPGLHHKTPNFQACAPAVTLTDSSDGTDLVVITPTAAGFLVNGDETLFQIRRTRQDPYLCTFTLPSGGRYQWRATQELSSTKETTAISMTLSIESKMIDNEQKLTVQRRLMKALNPGFVSDFSSLVGVARFETAAMTRNPLELNGILKPYGSTEDVNELPWKSREDCALIAASLIAACMALKYGALLRSFARSLPIN
ncbi:hypothetical protein BDR26DRAFT_850498 [Obelidium mucronatum]|nr:hypothetical protein BDR26DRAFT_850498 [Obelidium mucronatum]